MKYSKIAESNFFYLALLGALMIAAIIIINPIGNFPYEDDWAYGKPVKTLLETGKMRLTDWSSMTLVAHIWYGAAAAKLFWFSFTVLRFANLLMGFLGAAGVYFLLTMAAPSKKAAFAGSLLVLFNQVYFLLSFSFFTDIHFFAVIIWSVFFILKFFDSDKLIFFIISCLLSIYALLIRDLAVILPAAFAVGYIINKSSFKKTAIKIIIFNLLIWGGFFVYRYWLINIHGMTANMEFSRHRMMESLSSGVIRLLTVYFSGAIYLLLFLGFYLFPLVWRKFSARFMKFTGKWKLISVISIPAFVIALVFIMKAVPRFYLRIADTLMGHVPNYLVMHDINYPEASDLALLPSSLNFVFIIIAAAGAVMLAIELFFVIKSYFLSFNKKYLEESNGKLEFITAAIIFYCVPILSQFIFSRYLLFIIPLIIFLLFYQSETNRKISWKKWIIPAVSFIALLYLALAPSHDLMSYNRTRWQGIHYLERELKASPQEIDGGFEYNAWRMYDFKFKAKEGRNWWFVEDDKFIVGSGEVRGYAVLRKIPYQRWFPPKKFEIFVLERLKN